MIDDQEHNESTSAKMQEETATDPVTEVVKQYHEAMKKKAEAVVSRFMRAVLL